MEESRLIGKRRMQKKETEYAAYYLRRRMITRVFDRGIREIFWSVVFKLCLKCVNTKPIQLCEEAV